MASKLAGAGEDPQSDKRIRELRACIIETSADLLDDLKSNVSTSRVLHAAKDFLSLLKICIVETPRVFFPQARDGSNNDQRELQGFCSWLFNVLGVILVTPLFSPVHAEMRHVMEGLFSMLAQSHRPVLAAALLTLTRVLGLLIGRKLEGKNSHTIELNSGLPQRTLLIHLDNVPELYIKDVLQILYHYWDLINVGDAACATELLEIVLAVINSTYVTPEGKATILCRFPFPLCPKTVEGELLYVQIIAEVVKLRRMHKFDAVNQFLGSLYLNEIHGREGVPCPAFSLSLEGFLGRFIIHPQFSQVHYKDLDRRRVIKLYFQVREQRVSNGVNLPYAITSYDDPLDVADNLLANFPYALTVLTDRVVTQIFDFIHRYDTRHLMSLFVDLDFKGNKEYRKTCLDLIIASSIFFRVRATWTKTMALFDEPDAPVNCVASLEKSEGFFRLAAAVFDKLKAYHYKSLLKTKLAGVTGTRKPGFLLVDFRMMSMWIFSCYRDLDAATATEDKLIVMTQFIKCVRALSLIGVPRYEMFAPGSLKDLMRILVAPWFEFPKTPILEMHANGLQKDLHARDGELSYDNALTCRRIETLSLPIFLSEHRLVTKIFKSLAILPNVACNYGVLRCVGPLCTSALDMGLTWTELKEFFARIMNNDLWKDDEGNGIALSLAISRIPCILSKCREEWRPKTETDITRYKGCITCDNSKMCVEPVDYLDDLAKLCSQIFQFGREKMKVDIIGGLDHLRRHGVGPSTTIVSIFARNLNDTSPSVRRDLVQGLIFFLNGCVVSPELKECIRILFLFWSQQMHHIVSLDIQTEVHIILSELKTMAQTPCPELATEIAKFTVEILTLRWNNCVATDCREVFRIMAKRRSIGVSTYMSRIRVLVGLNLVKAFLHRIFGPTVLSTNQKHPNEREALDKCDAVLRSIEFAMEFRREDFIRIYYPVFLTYLIPNIDNDGRKLLMVRGLASLAAQSVKTLLELHFPFYYSALAMQNPLRDVNATLISLRALGIEPEISASAQIQLVMNEMISYWSTDKRRMFSCFKSLLLWAEGKRHRIPASQTLVKEEVMDFISSRLMGYHVYLDCKMYNEFDGIETKRRVLSSFAKLIGFLGKERMSGSKMRIFNVLNTLSAKPYLQDLLLKAWKAYVYCLEDSGLSSLMNQILASVLFLQKNKKSEEFEELAKYFIVEKKNFTAANLHTVYYLEKHFKDANVREVVTSAKYSGMRFFEFLISELTHGNTHVRYQSLLAVRNIIKGKDSTLNIKGLLESSQLIDPIICRLIVALLDCTHSQDTAVAFLSVTLFGELGAQDYYRMKLKSMDRRSRRDPTEIFPMGQKFALRLFELFRKQYQGTELSVPENVDICAYSIQELLRIYNVNVELEHSLVWRGLSLESRVIFHSLLTSLYCIKDVIPLETYPCPIYGSEYGKSFQDWCNNFILELYTFILPSQNKEIIRCSLPILVRSLPIATHFLPFVALYAALDGTSAQRRVIFEELNYIMRLWVTIDDDNTDNSSTQQMAWIGQTSPVPFARNRRRRKFQNIEPEQRAAVHKDRVLVTNAAFTTIDMITYIARYGTRDFATVNAIASTGRADGFKHPRVDLPTNGVLDSSKILNLFRVIPDPRFMYRAAFHTESYHRALMNLEEFLAYFPEQCQKYLPILQRIYVPLKDFDSLIGVVAQRKHKPNPIEDILDKLATGNSEEAAAKFRIIMQTGFSDFMSEHALVQAYISIEQPQMAITILNGLSRRGVDVGSTALGNCRLEACWKLHKWTELEKILKNTPKDSTQWSLSHAEALFQIKHREYEGALKTIRTAKAQSLVTLAASPVNINSYLTRYGEMTRLHVLTEMEQMIDVMKTGEGPMNPRKVHQFQIRVKNLLCRWNDRLAMVQNSLKIVEPILNTRKALLCIMKTNAPRKDLRKLFLPPVCDAWLRVANMESKAQNYVRANNCIQEALRFKSAEGLILEAKLLGKRSDMDRGITVLEDCIKQYYSKKTIAKWKARRDDVPATLHQITCSKALLLLARFNDEKCNVDIEVNIQNYEQATEVYKRSEKNFFHLANYYDNSWGDASSSKKKVEMQTSVVRYYCKSLLYGCKHIHQSLPRLLFIWFDYGAAKPDTNNGNGNGKKMGQGISVVTTYNAVVKEMTEHVANLFQRVPPYVFLTGFSQLISRICHCNLHIWAQLKYMIVEIILAHPHQALWMMMAVSKSSYARRKERCNEIFKEVEAKQGSKKAMIRDYTTLAEKLIELANKDVGDRLRSTAIEHLLPSLPKLFSNPQFSKVIVPFQQFLCVSIPRVTGNHLTYDAFPQDAVYISGMERNVDVMPSLQRPKKITLRGSDGKLYGLMCKPTDDLRKDSKVMEMNNVVNWYLARTASTRERNLHIHTYAVVPLNEETGLLEWVPNLTGFRQILTALYKERKVGIDNRNIRGMLPNNTANIQERIKVFKHNYLRRHPPVFREWFLNTFSDPQEWYLARMSYIRSAAVMSIVGYIMGLGDRHGENILMDSSSGEVVHVDFNCLFNKGQGFHQPERVPFRLTQNMVDAMGPLGYEGVFRQCCENTLRVLRDNTNVFISVLRPFVNDPLVEWTRKSKEKEAGTGEVENEKAVEHLRNIRLRFSGVSRNNTKELDVALSVEAQVNHLIKEATSLENLCQMYIGWGAYL